MATIQGLCFFAVEQLTGAETGVESARRLLAALQEHLTDHSENLPQALKRASRNAWKALELALAGNSLSERVCSLLASGDRRAFAEQVRAFLNSCPLPEGVTNDPGFRQACLRDIRLAERRGLLEGSFNADDLARRVGEFARFSSPVEVVQARQQALNEIAAVLREAGLVNLARLVALQPGEQPSLLVMGVRYFFRREVGCDEKLARGLTFSQLEGINQAQETGFASLAELLSQQGENLEKLLGGLHALSAQTHAEVLDIHTELLRQGGQLGDLYQAVLELGERLKVGHREVSPQDCQSVNNEADLRKIRDVKTRYWSLPEGERRRTPALGNAVGALSMAAGDYPDAQKAFTLAAETAVDEKAQAVAHLNAYRAALQQHQWEAALVEFNKAVSHGGRSIAPFPVERYRPERILGAGGFGVAFLCKHTRTEGRVVVKAIQGEQFDREVPAIFREAMALEMLEHPAIVRVRECDYTDPDARSRPYLVMDYFDGVTLAEQVRRNGPLPIPDFLEVAGQVASALAAAHARGILHRDVKPANILLRKQSGRWQVKLIDFGLAFRLRSVQETVQRPQSMQNTLLGRSIAGTIDYAAPEQMGKLPGVAVSPASDVYGFGKTCCFALFTTPTPGRRHWKQLDDEALCDLLDACLAEPPQDRPATFDQVLSCLRAGSVGKQPSAEEGKVHSASVVSEQVRQEDLARRDLIARVIEGVILYRQAEAQSVAEQAIRSGGSGGKEAPSHTQATFVPVPEAEVPGEPFRFCNGKLARTLDEFVSVCGELACQDVEWHLDQGHIGPWLRYIGKADLADELFQLRLRQKSPGDALFQFLRGCGERGQIVAAKFSADLGRYRAERQRQADQERERQEAESRQRQADRERERLEKQRQEKTSQPAVAAPSTQQPRATNNNPVGDYFKRNRLAPFHLMVAISLALLLLRWVGCLPKDYPIPFFDRNKPAETRPFKIPR
jgi:serine/threonine protein kinase